MPPAEMDEEGGYRPNSGSYDDLNDKPEASLSINPKSIKGLENYRGNDTVNLTVKVRLPQDMEGEEGMIEPEIISVTAEPMEDGARVTRMREKAGRTF